MLLLLVTMVGVRASAAQDGRAPRGDRAPRSDRPLPALPADLAPLDRLSVVLGRPTDRSVTVSILSADAREGYCEYGGVAGRYTHRTASTNFPAARPVDVLLDNLPPDTTCHYRLRCRAPNEASYTEGAAGAFRTQRAPGSTFMFEVQGDSHPERPQQFDAALYAQTLRAAAADRPDFYLLLGDDFSVDTLRTVNADTVAQRYRFQRPFLALVAQSAPLFLVNGNHEQAAMCNLDGTANNVAVWAQTARNRFFPQPAPDGFYTGDTTNMPFIGALRDYYAWTWGDALFVVIDPYWHSSVPVDNVFNGGPKNGDLWSVTLGEAQYRWFGQTLASSRARFKFVFTHHVLGTGRGGIEGAGLYEWGGRSRRGDWEFAQKRPGWELPIHPLMATNGVTIFFQGHDHIFARQQLGGVVYQTLSEPADPNYVRAEWGSAYRTGDTLPGSGRVRVRVAPEKVRVEYVRSRLPKDATPAHPDGEIAFAYEIPAP
ncbi:MAG: metallophosphoesterase [bacterium]